MDSWLMFLLIKLCYFCRAWLFNIQYCCLGTLSTLPSLLCAGHVSQNLVSSLCLEHTTGAHLKELRHDILSHFFDVLNCGSAFGKIKNNGVLRKKNTKELVLKQKVTRMAEINGLEMTILKSLAIFSTYTNDDVASLIGL